MKQVLLDKQAATPAEIANENRGGVSQLVSAATTSSQTPLRSSQTLDERALRTDFRLHPDLPDARQLKKPGAFRRAFVLEDVRSSDGQIAAARVPFRTDIELLDRHHVSFFITDVRQTRPDGTVVRFESRPYRRGREPIILSRSHGELPPPQQLRLCGVRFESIPWWVTMSFFLGALLFAVGSVCWMVPTVGDEEHHATMLHADLSVFTPFVVGALLFSLGAYLSWVEVLNANLQEELGALSLSGSTHRAALTQRSLPAATSQRAAHANGWHVHAVQSRNEQARSTAPPAEASTTASQGRQQQQDTLPQPRLQPQIQEGADEEELTHQAQQAQVHSRGVRLDEARLQEQHAEQHAEQQVDPEKGPAAQTISYRGGYRWLGWQPRSLLYWALLVQFIGSLLFDVCCVFSFGHALDWAAVGGSTRRAEMVLVFMPSLLGSAAFTFASYVQVAEVTHSFNVFRLPDRCTIGYVVVCLNLLGSLLFLVASCGYFVHGSSEKAQLTWDFEVSEWMVRFGFAVGSLCFLFGALFSLPEVITDKDERIVQLTSGDVA